MLDCTLTFGRDEFRAWELHLSNKAANTANHAHVDAEIHIVTKGCKKYILNFDKEILLRPGQLLLIAPNVFHEELVFSEEPVEEHSISFHIKNDDNMMFEQSPYYHIESDTEKAIECFLDMEKELSGEGCFCGEMIPGYITVLYGKLLKLCNVESKQEEKTGGIIRQQIIIDEYFNDLFLQKTWKYTTEELAAKLHISQRHLNRILHELYGMSFSERLVYIKLKYAEAQLIHTDKSVEQISEECRWSTTNFLREFKIHYGMNPSQFKKNALKRTQI